MRKRVISCRMVRTRKAYKACARGQKPPSCLSAPHASEQSLPRPRPRSCAARDSLASHPGAPVFDHGARGWSGCHCHTRPDDFGLLIAGFDSFHWFRLPIAYEPGDFYFEGSPPLTLTRTRAHAHASTRTLTLTRAHAHSREHMHMHTHTRACSASDRSRATPAPVTRASPTRTEPSAS